ncbi:Receptor-like protein kinase [Quillaja saponaria]|uniref:non-specific serine/threonine protein kinase n=1 Tax=Quillaja saponaria TaxID=32244 RepID=A0AAD7LHH3_QUISA|nr:Receptor-like protein kinase [Quillaja saponaria]
MGFFGHLLFHFALLVIPTIFKCFPGVESAALSIITDREALISFKSKLSYDGSNPLFSWNQNSILCNWTHVTCNKFGHRVVALDLSGLSLTGDISPHIGNMSFLRSLRLQNNQFTGMLPDQIGNLFRLRVLNLSSNSIQGTLHLNLSKLTELQILDVTANKFMGRIPEDMSFLTKLRVLKLGQNNLSGVIPPTIGNISSLTNMSFATNALSGGIPSDLGRLEKLMELDLTINNLSGTIPPSLYNLSSPVSLGLASNQLWGEIPDNVGDKLPNLLVVILCFNKFTGGIPGSLHNLTNIQVIRMAHNFMEGTVPPGLGNLPSLLMYNIGFNNFVSSGDGGLRFITSLTNSTHLSYLSVDDNQLEGVIPEAIGNLSKGLSKLYMGGNHIFGKIPASIGRLSGLRLLNLSYNAISGEIPPELGLLVELQTLKFGWKSDFRKYSKLSRATGNFNQESLIGNGGFGSVYKGYLSQGIAVAVKVLDTQRTEFGKSFFSECEALRNVRHRNIVRLITSCSSVDFKNMEFLALVYEYLSNGSLEDWIKGKRKHANGDGLNLLERLNVVIDVVCALDYLHHDSEVPVVHCDLKPSNILLDEFMTAKVGDFGLARLLMERSGDRYSISSTHVLKGSIGYIPPEYGLGAKPSVAGDVYSFGVMLLELFSGRCPTHDRFKEGRDLTSWVQSEFPANIVQVIDPELPLTHGKSSP